MPKPATDSEASEAKLRHQRANWEGMSLNRVWPANAMQNHGEGSRTADRSSRSRPVTQITQIDLKMRHSYAVIDGMHLHWAEMGKASDAVPVVLLHGMSDSHLTWKLVAPLLAAHRRVLMPDLFGCGLSERPDASYELAWHARVVADWLSHLGIERADVVGHSFGGGVALRLLFECPERVRRLALVAPGGLGRGVGIWLRLVTSVARVVELFGQPFMALGTRLALRGTTFSAEEVAERSAMNAKRGTARAFARTARDVINWQGQSRLFLQHAHKIPSLSPIAVYWGDRDLLIPMDQGTAFAKAVKGVVFKPFAGCGHYLHHEQPEAFVGALREFLDVPYAEEVCLPQWRTGHSRDVADRSPSYWSQLVAAPWAIPRTAN